jgi:hypothetical protein
MGTINTGHFEAEKNVTRGQRYKTDAILEELLAQAKVDIQALEADVTLAKTAPTLTPAAEAADVIAITFASPIAAVRQYIVEVYDTNMEVNDAAYTVTENGAGAIVAGDGKARMIFTTDASGAAQIDVTDVVGASNTDVFLSFRQLNSSADAVSQCAPAEVSITFDAS